jgi:hypothetical protein
MRNLIVVAFLEPVTEGMDFPRDRWPLHITLVKFDVVDLPASDDGPAAGEVLAARVAGHMDAPVRAALGSTVAVGGEAGFGRGGSIPVSLIRPSPALQGLHEALVGVVEALPGRIATPGYAMAGYRPHGHGSRRQTRHAPGAEALAGHTVT